MRSKKSQFIVTVLSLFIFAVLISCAANRALLQVQNALPQDELAYYSDNFDKLREELWDFAGYLYREEQLQNFIQVDYHFKNGKLIARTKTGTFCKGGLASKYSLRGDFDIQLDCRMEFMRGNSSMDQMFAFAVFDTNMKIEETNSVIIGLSKKEGSVDGYLYSNCFIGGEKIRGNSKEIDSFSGAFRILRRGKYISALYRKKGATEWNFMNTFHATNNDMAVGFVLGNFFPERTTIRAEHSLSVEIDNFSVNAAQDILEEDI